MFLPLTLISLLLSQTHALYFPAGDPSNDHALHQRAVGPPFVSPPPVDDSGRESEPDTSHPSTPNTVIAAIASRSSVAAAQSTAGISLGSPNKSLPDPCGPPTQPPGDPNSKSTCHANVSIADTSAFQAYGVTCQNDKSGYVLNQYTCEDALRTACMQISGEWGAEYQHTDKWIWTREDGNCTFGYWLPKGGAPPPDYERCWELITGVMNEQCKGPKYNSASVNLSKMPSASAEEVTGTGEPVDGGYPSYVMVPQASYCGVNSEDSC